MSMDTTVIITGVNRKKTFPALRLSALFHAAWLASLLFSLCISPVYADDYDYSSLRLPPVPVAMEGVENHAVSLNGTWEFFMNPPFFLRGNTAPKGEWQPITVPGECATQGFAIEHNKEYTYRTHVDVPSDFAGRKILIRFSGVYSYARVWINGHYIRDHHGGFTVWDCDI